MCGDLERKVKSLTAQSGSIADAELSLRLERVMSPSNPWRQLMKKKYSEIQIETSRHFLSVYPYQINYKESYRVR